MTTQTKTTMPAKALGVGLPAPLSASRTLRGLPVRSFSEGGGTAEWHEK
jgi:hypothetical protein